MATDATGTPSSLGIPTIDTSADRPTGVAINEIVASINALLVATTINMPTGAILPYGGATAPTGWQLCDGTALSTTAQAALHAIIGDNYGTGGAGTFKVPDMRGRSAVGAGQGAALTNRSLGQTGGAESVALALGEMPSHSHSTLNGVLGGFAQAVLQPPSGGGAITLWGVPSGQASLDMQTSVKGSGSAHANMQPFVVVNHIIKL